MNRTSPRRRVTALPARSERTANGLGRNAATGDDDAGCKGAVVHNTGWRSFDRAGALPGLRALPPRVASREYDGFGTTDEGYCLTRPGDTVTSIEGGVPIRCERSSPDCSRPALSAVAFWDRCAQAREPHTLKGRAIATQSQDGRLVSSDTRRSRSFLIALGVLHAGLLVAMLASFAVLAADPLDQYRAEREAWMNDFRVNGTFNVARLKPLIGAVSVLAGSAVGETRARVLLELGTLQRLEFDMGAAAATLTEAAAVAATVGLRDVAFDAWIGTARAQLAVRNHGAAASALERATDAAGANPTARQRSDLALFQAELLANRGEIEAGLVAAVQAVRLAQDGNNRFQSQLQVGDDLDKLVNRCDFRLLRDSKSDDPQDDDWGACRRALALARSAYEQAANTADGLGWHFLAARARQFQQDLSDQLTRFEFRAQSLKQPDIVGFAPRSRRDVLVHRVFTTEASGPVLSPQIVEALKSAVAGAEALNGRPDARSLELRALMASPQSGGNSIELLARASNLLSTERSTFFDPRRRGTTSEDREDIVPELALRLLAYGREAEAFAAFESVRARGLGELSQILARPDVTDGDRVWLATLLRLDAQAGELEAGIVRHMTGEQQLGVAAEQLARLDHIRADRVVLLHANEAARARFASTQYTSTSLDALRQAATQADVPVLLFWTTSVNVIVWYVGPHGSDPEEVFLPLPRLSEKVRRVLKSSATGGEQFDETAARELYLYLISPFENVLTSKRIMIIPQGPLVDLPFEALIDPVSGKPLIERWAVSYAPNATMALQALQRRAVPISHVAAVVDVDIDDKTKETKGIADAGSLRGPVLFSDDVLPDKLDVSLNGADAAHLLLHGVFDDTEPLLSFLKQHNDSGTKIFAADVIGLRLRGIHLVVLSACESGRVEARISNEIYGFPWALLANGVPTAVVSRWEVDSETNALWMRRFYQAVSDGTSATEAAAQAMRALRKAGYVNPYYWAAMQVNGQ
jgi:CHAT domain-containing protein